MRFKCWDSFDDSEDLDGKLSSEGEHAAGVHPLYGSWPSFADRPSVQHHERARGSWNGWGSMSGSFESNLAKRLQGCGLRVRIGPHEGFRSPFRRERIRISNRSFWFGWLSRILRQTRFFQKKRKDTGDGDLSRLVNGESKTRGRDK
jgi:hypothetical protein